MSQFLLLTAGPPKGPKKYCPQIVDELCEWIAKGANNEEAARLSGITEETFYNWQRPKKTDGQPNPDYHPELSESLKKAEVLRKTTLTNRILTASKRSWQAAAWYLERRFPEEYGEKRTIEVIDPEAEIKRVLRIIKGEEIVEDAKPIPEDKQGLLPQSNG